MVLRILVDTNVLLDYLLGREPFEEDARNIGLPVSSTIEGNELKGANNRAYIVYYN